jgi:hypothetical protein
MNSFGLLKNAAVYVKDQVAELRAEAEQVTQALYLSMPYRTLH